MRLNVTYRSGLGSTVIDHHVEELFELQDLIERGPDWNALVEIKVVLNPIRATRPGVTMEEVA
jgi:hypothetical protein